MTPSESKKLEAIKKFWAGSPILDEGEDMSWLIARLEEKDREIGRLRGLEAIWEQKTAAEAIVALNRLIKRAENAEAEFVQLREELELRINQRDAHKQQTGDFIEQNKKLKIERDRARDMYQVHLKAREKAEAKVEALKDIIMAYGSCKARQVLEKAEKG